LKNESKAATDFLKKLVLNRAQSLPNLGRWLMGPIDFLAGSVGLKNVHMTQWECLSKFPHLISQFIQINMILTPFSLSPMTDTVVDSLPALFLAYCTLTDSDDLVSVNDRVTPWASASDPVPLLTDWFHCHWSVMPRPSASGMLPLPLVKGRWPIVPLPATYLNYLV
jgi:hypothetical protein